jgi:hypothetical protein
VKTLARAGDRSEIVRRLQAVRPDSPRQWGRMSAHQMVCHVADAYRMALGRKPVAETSSLFQRTVVKGIALYLPLPWPAGIRTSGELDQETGAGTLPTDLAADLLVAGQLLESFLDESPRLSRMRHPVFGAMSVADWLRWGYLHTDHHLRQFGA